MHRLSVLILPAVAAVATAQAPRITPAGDPTVKADTIYRMAVNPQDYPEETAAFLLDDGVLRVEADGRGTRTFRQIVQVLRPEAVDRYREHQFSYAPKHQKFTLNWIRVVKPDGTVISAAPTQVQESDVPAEMGDPTYSDRKVVRASVTGVAPGTIVDYSYTTEELKPFLTGDFFETWGVSTGLRVKRSRYIVDFPAGFSPRITEENLNFKRVETTAGGRHTYMWATGDLPKLKPEEFASDSNGVYMSVLISSPTAWSGIGKWYAENARSRYAPSKVVDDRLAEVFRGARTIDDSIRAAHRFAAQDIRYVSIALGLGGYQPRTPAEVITTGFGDCKDKATLFVVAMEKLGITAYPVILNSRGHVRRAMPSIEQLDHAIAAYKRRGSTQWEYADLTAELTPLGELPFSYQGEFGLIVKKDGTTEEITFPKSSAADNRIERRLIGSLSTAGLFTGKYEETGYGARQYELRRTFENPLDSTQRAKGATAMAGSLFEGAKGDSLVAFSGKDLAATPRISVFARDGKAASMAGSNAILTNPFGSMAGMARLAEELESAGPRRFPIDAEQIFGTSETRLEFRLTLPEGWRAQLPANIDAVSPFGEVHTSYAQDGRDLVMHRTIRGVAGIRPPADLPVLVTWLKDVAKDDAKLIVINTGK